jgi:hypothetical protein
MSFYFVLRSSQSEESAGNFKGWVVVKYISVAVLTKRKRFANEIDQRMKLCTSYCPDFFLTHSANTSSTCARLSAWLVFYFSTPLI